MARDGGKSGRDGGLSAAGGDFFHLVIDYAKQETLGPLKSLGRFLVFGLIGSIAITAGVLGVTHAPSGIPQIFWGAVTGIGIAALAAAWVVSRNT